MRKPATKLALGDTLLDNVSAHPQYSPYAGFPTSLSVAQAILPYPQFYGVYNFYAYNVSSNYNSFQLTLTKHTTKGLGFIAAYTFYKTLGFQDSNGAMGYGARVMLPFVQLRIATMTVSNSESQVFWQN